MSVPQIDKNTDYSINAAIKALKRGIWTSLSTSQLLQYLVDMNAATLAAKPVFLTEFEGQLN